MSEVEALTKQKEDAIYYMELRDAARRLYINPDFKKLILEEYLLHECARYGQMSANPVLTKEQREDALLICQSAGAFKRFMSAVIQKGNHGESQKEALEQAIIDAENPSPDDFDEEI